MSSFGGPVNGHNGRTTANLSQVMATPGSQGYLASQTIPTGPDNERTVSQVLQGWGPDALLPPGVLTLAPMSMQSGWLRKVRLMRRDATLGFLRDIFYAGIFNSDWSVTETKPEFQGAVKDIEESFLPHRDQIIVDMIRGWFDFGWQPWELVKEQRPDGTLRVTKVKGLLQDLTQVLVNYYGSLVGLRNMALHNVQNPNPVYLFRGDALVVTRDPEGTDWYGEALIRRAERPYDTWIESDDAARRFDNKVAGATWVVYYPPGTTKLNGVATDNFQIATCISDALYSSGKIVVPIEVMKFVEDLNVVDPTKLTWRIELVSAQTQQSFFVDRGKYLDALKARAVGIPERAIFEGQFGTKAEAEAHSDFAIDNIEMTHKKILHQVNKQAVNYLLEVNHGPEFKDQVKIEAAPLSDTKRSLVKQLFMSHFGTPDGQAMRADRIDWNEIQEMLGIPETPEHQKRDEEGRGDEQVGPGQRRLVGPLVGSPPRMGGRSPTTGAGGRVWSRKERHAQRRAGRHS